MRPFKTYIIILVLISFTVSSCRHESYYDEAHALYIRGTELRKAKQNEDAAKCFSEALVTLSNCDTDNSRIKEIKAKTEDCLGEIYWLQGLFNDALSLHLDASTLFRELNNKLSLMIALRNAGRASASLKNLEDAEIYYNDALEIAKSLDDKDFINETNLDLARDIYMESGDYEKTISLVNQVLENDVNIYQCHLILGLAYYYLEDDDNAITHLNEAVKSEKAGARMSAYQTLYSIYQLRGDYAKALVYHELFNDNMIAADDLHCSENMQRIKSEYDLKMQENISEAKLRSKTLYFSLVLAVLVIALTITAIILRQRKLKSQLEAEKNKNQFETALKKNKVYVTALALSEQITKNNLEFQLDDDSWNDFMNLINLIYNDFNKKLIEKYPSLTKEDLHICSLTRLGFNNQVIAILLNQQTNSYARRKSRIKKEKMNGMEDTRSFKQIIENIK